MNGSVHGVDNMCGYGDVIPGVAAPMDTVDGVQLCLDCDVYRSDLEAAAALARLVPGGAVVKFIQDVTLQPRIYMGTDDEVIASPSNPWIEDAWGRVIDWENSVLWADGGPRFAYVEVSVGERILDLS